MSLMDPQSATDAVTAASAVTGPWGIGVAFVLSVLGGFGAWRKVQRERVDTASDKGQVSYMKMIVADRDAALLRATEQMKRADDYAKRFYELMGQIGELKGKLETLTTQVKTQSEEIARLRVQLEQRT